MEGKIQTIKINEIINYADNPRHAVGNDERDTLEKLFNAVGMQYMLNLAEDIQKNGLLGNQQIVVVYSDECKKYVVYEGNRRVAAMKLLLMPELFDFLDKATKEKAHKIAERNYIEENIVCYVTNEEEAFFIMERVHSGEDKGRGVKQWSAREKDAFRVRRSNVKNLSYLIDFYVKKFFDGLDITSILPFTTIQRIFNSHDVRKRIGLSIEDENTFTIEKMQLVVEASRWIVREAEETGIAVTRLFNTADSIKSKMIPWIDKYLEDDTVVQTENSDSENNGSQDDKGVTEDNKREGTTSNTTGEQDNSQAEGEDKSHNSNKASGANRALPYFFQGIKYDSLDRNDIDAHGVIAVCRELQLFSDRKMVPNFPLASAFLMRSIVEHSIKYYSKKHKIQGQDRYIWEDIKNIEKLSKIIEKYKKNLPNYIVDATMRQYFMTLFGDYEKNIDPLNWVVHRPAEFQLDTNTLLDLPKKGLLALINYLLS